MAFQGTWHWEGRASVPPVKACDWWFDLREDDHLTPEHKAMVKTGPRDGRTIIARHPHEVEVEDRVGGGKPLRVTLRREGSDRLLVQSSTASRSLTAVYRFDPDVQGCHIVADTRVEAHGVFGLLMPFFHRKMAALHQKDMDIHLSYMERDWKDKPW
jgi:hypothetical protein